MKIILKHTTRLKPGGEWLRPGTEVDVPKNFADELIAKGAAEPVEKPAKTGGKSMDGTAE